MAVANLRLLIAMTRDADFSNRDWAIFLLAQEEIDSPSVRAALLYAAENTTEDMVVRSQAIWGLTRRDPAVALPFVQAALHGRTVDELMLETALLCAHPSLIADLRIWAEPSEDPDMDALAAQALAACETAGWE
ncbi:HEAT repeat domain-containing protein [Sphingomonas colocasiae]|nr:HEAT repeat domain-containing protein [Sphingomonas colocasiae]